MQELSSVFHNQILIVALAACISAQMLKIPIDLIRYKKADLRSLFSAGGMPSAHSALVGALATSVGQTKGWDSAEFAIACLFAVIVMYDAAGVRQAAGKQARILNQIIEDMFQEQEFKEEKLKELLGHTPVQVLVGLSLGISIAFLANTQFV
ncbi:acid phosphatase/vanadium-dependent haloperoxidase related protein [[Leptolyngbya] sp. PCC 7376]|uniref:divergent PAP2 family protein n=1 Tax=[Leptolyngbya] sp. PCC 7376 TaxID=111781 RepID=UPI00029F1311|nr:divergent PAP2 family protein [[Leptolyngbya] sp. PCC 7376]AFY39206.1 acid phosphatase/vanadium-dependent haloperoxidase related protein [[Leptolyngbya] sp. PCC 7376]